MGWGWVQLSCPSEGMGTCPHRDREGGPESHSQPLALGAAWSSPRTPGDGKTLDAKKRTPNEAEWRVDSLKFETGFTPRPLAHDLKKSRDHSSVSLLSCQAQNASWGPVVQREISTFDGIH